MAEPTRVHREAAVLAMFPHCRPGSPLWDEFVVSGEGFGESAPDRVAKAIAEAEERGAKKLAHLESAIEWNRLHRGTTLTIEGYLQRATELGWTPEKGGEGA